ncbi:hypothetical protein ACJZ2D_002231 [Fusarium nematophilum]
MSYYFQPPIFPLYLIPGAGPVPLIPGTYIPYLVAPLRIQPAALPASIPLMRIRIKVIFHRDGGALASNDLAYEGPQSREALLSHLAWWSGVHGLGGRVYSGQVTLYLTSTLSTMRIFPGVGPVPPEYTLRVVSLAEQLPAREFEAMMLDIINGPLGAFLIVDIGAFDRFHQPSSREPPPLQQQHGPGNNDNEPDRQKPPVSLQARDSGVDRSPSPEPNPSGSSGDNRGPPTDTPPPDSPVEPNNTNDPPPSSPKTDAENVQTPEPDISKWDGQGNSSDAPEPDSGGTANG